MAMKFPQKLPKPSRPIEIDRIWFLLLRLIGDGRADHNKDGVKSEAQAERSDIQ